MQHLCASFLFYPPSSLPCETANRSMDAYEISITFADSGHGGDKRKTSQQCTLSRLSWVYTCHIVIDTAFMQGLAAVGGGHKQHGFAKSKALRGAMNNIPRARVMELTNPEVDRPLAAHFRVPWTPNPVSTPPPPSPRPSRGSAKRRRGHQSAGAWAVGWSRPAGRVSCSGLRCDSQ